MIYFLRLRNSFDEFNSFWFSHCWWRLFILFVNRHHLRPQNINFFCYLLFLLLRQNNWIIIWFYKNCIIRIIIILFFWAHFSVYFRNFIVFLMLSCTNRSFFGVWRWQQLLLFCQFKSLVCDFFFFLLSFFHSVFQLFFLLSFSIIIIIIINKNNDKFLTVFFRISKLTKLRIHRDRLLEAHTYINWLINLY